MLGKDRDVTGATDHTADGFAEYFTRKVDNIRADTANTPAPVIADTATCSWSYFHPTTEEEVGSPSYNHVVTSQVGFT